MSTLLSTLLVALLACAALGQDAAEEDVDEGARADRRATLRTQFEALALDITDAELDQLLRYHVVDPAALAALRATPVPFELAPFDPHQLSELAAPHAPSAPLMRALAAANGWTPAHVAETLIPADLPWHQWSLAEQAAGLRAGRFTVTELVQAHLDHLAAIDAELFCVAAPLTERALAQAALLDAEAAAGRWRGPLHGIPFGIKDLLQAEGAPTEWGAAPFVGQSFQGDAPVVAKLVEAGAVPIAKLTLGALAMGDVWYGGQTRNPWAPARGSSGSSAGPAAAVAAGGVTFAIGSETLGSIVSPSVRCSVTGLRPTLGRVSRVGAMPLSWSMDKLGPMARSAEDALLVLTAMAGAEEGAPHDPHLAWSAPLASPFTQAQGAPRTDPGSPPARPTLRIAYVADPNGQVATWLDELATALPGVAVEPVALDLGAAGTYPTDAMLFVLFAEAAAAFDALTRDGRDDELVDQKPFAWPNTFRSARLIPAVEYIQCQRLRSGLARDFEAVLQTVDLVVHRPFEGELLALTNLTGHPSLTFPVPLATRAQPSALTLTGRLADEAFLAAVASAWQRRADAGRPAFPPAFAALRPAPTAGD